MATAVERRQPGRDPYARFKPWTLPDGILYGPFATRRKGMSLGVNLLPPSEKVCSFNCVYCQCGWTPGKPPPAEELRRRCPDLPTVRETLDREFPRLRQAGRAPDSIVLSGNGEPTLYPDFPEAVEVLLAARDRHLPGIPITLLTDGTELGRPEIRAAALRVDHPTVKLDAGDEQSLRRVDIPLVPFSVGTLLGWLREMPPVVLQACFVRGVVDNATPAAVEAWVAAALSVRPRRVEVYSLDRVPPARGLEKVSAEDLERIAERVRAAGIPAEAYS